MMIRDSKVQITDVACNCTSCGWAGLVGVCEPDIDGDGSLGCPICHTIIVVPGPPRIPLHRRVVCFDFDATIADYSEGFQGVGVFGEPIPGVAEAFHRLAADGWRIIILTARREAETPFIERYLDKHRIPYSKVATKKPSAHVYVGDRALRFDGDWEKTLHDILEFEPYYYREQGERTNLEIDKCAICPFAERDGGRRMVCCIGLFFSQFNNGDWRHFKQSHKYPSSPPNWCPLRLAPVQLSLVLPDGKKEAT